LAALMLRRYWVGWTVTSLFVVPIHDQNFGRCYRLHAFKAR
jgi:hypothetical protein